MKSQFFTRCFRKFKMEQMFALEDLLETYNESNYNQAVEKVELNGPGWAFDRITNSSINLFKNVTKKWK